MLQKNPDQFVSENSDEEIRRKLEAIHVKTITFTEWKRVEDKGKLRWKQVQTEIERTKFIELFMRNIQGFREHVERVKVQYGQMRDLRENLDDWHIMVWMDFAENFTCTAVEEVASAYWTADVVTLHTSVVYFPKSHNKTHVSIVGISEILSHKSSTVFA